MKDAHQWHGLVHNTAHLRRCNLISTAWGKGVVATLIAPKVATLGNYHFEKHV